MIGIDTHVHTKEGSLDCRVSIHETVDILKSKGYDAVLITDHNSYKGYDAWVNSGRTDFKVLCGIEYDTLDAGHIIVIMPAGTRLDILEHRGLGLMELCNIVHTHGGILGPAHPYGYGKMGIGNSSKWMYDDIILERFDFIEVYNSCIDDSSNEMAKALANMYKKVSLAGSDSHRVGCVGLSKNIIDYEIETEDDLIAAIRKGKVIENIGNSYGKSVNKHGIIYRILVYCFYAMHLIICKTHRKRLNKLKREIG